MEEGGGGFRPGKKSADKSGEVDYKTKSGTAWSHSFLNQKPWHPLSYPNQRRKWIAEQTHSQNERRAEEVAREYAQQQDFLRQTALLSKKEKEKLEMMQAVSFLYVKPPGYNAESAKAAEIADEKRKLEQSLDEGSSSMKMENGPSTEEKKKSAPKDVFGRSLPTEEQFEVLKNAPKLDTGVAGRAKPFGVEIRNVKCLRCGNYGHQSGDRECPLKDAIMPNEESRLKRDDPLTTIQAQVDSSEPLKWELKQKPGMSPPRGGFDPDDPNQQIVADDNDIFDEYGGFLGEASIPELLTNFSSSKTRKKKKRKKSDKSKPMRRSPSPNEVMRGDEGSESSSGEEGRRKIKKRCNKKKRKISDFSPSESSDSDRQRRRNRHKHHHASSSSSEASDSDVRESSHQKLSESSPSDNDRHRRRRRRKRHDHRHSSSSSSEASDSDVRESRHQKLSESSPLDSDRHRRRRKRHNHHHSSSGSSEASDSDDRGRRRHHHQRHSHRHRHRRQR